MLTVFARAVILFAAAVIAMRLMGKRQVGQLQPFELVVVIMIAELAATPMGSVGVPLLYGILPMLALVICHGLLTFFSMKSERLRVWLCGRPTVLIRNGVICERQLRKTSFTLNDLMEELRMGGIQDPAEVATAVLETSGTVSVFPKADSRPGHARRYGLGGARRGTSAAAGAGRACEPCEFAARRADGGLVEQGAFRAGLRLPASGAFLLCEHTG